jgi:hypothetical protein
LWHVRGEAIVLEISYATDDYSAEACAARRAAFYERHPMNAVELATNLVLKYRNENIWCQKGNNRGACLLAADELTRYLEKHDITQTSVQFGTYNSQPHAWLEVLDKNTGRYVIIDPTADQFGADIPEIVVGSIDDLPQYQYENHE